MHDDVHHELERKKRVADQMVTAHAIREQYFRRVATALDVGLMVASLFLVIVSITAIFHEELGVVWVNINLNVLVISGSVLVLVFSLAEWRVGWKVRADRHGEAFRSYSGIKAELVKLLSNLSRATNEDIRRITEKYESVGERVISIPERKFLKLKQAHLQKIYISRLLDRYPFAWKWSIRLRAQIKHSIGAMRHEDK